MGTPPVDTAGVGGIGLFGDYVVFCVLTIFCFISVVSPLRYYRLNLAGWEVTLQAWRENSSEIQARLCWVIKRSDESLSNDDKGLKEFSETIKVTSGDKTSESGIVEVLKS